MATAGSFPFSYDFYHLWCAGRRVIEGGNPYDVPAIAAEMAKLGHPEAGIFFGFLQLPTSIWLYTLLALLPFHLARMVWTIGIVGGALASATIIGRLRTEDSDGGGGLEGWLPIGATLLYPFTAANVVWGQYNIIPLLAVLVSLYWYRNGAYFRCGVALSLVLFKPQIVLPVVAYLGTLALRRGNMQLLVGATAGVVVQLSASLLLCPDALRWFMAAPLADATRLPGAAPAVWLASSTGIKGVPMLLALGGCGVGMVVGLYREMRSAEILLLLIPLGLVTAPYAWSHTFVLLLPSFLYAAGALFRHHKTLAPYLLGAVVYPFFATMLRPSQEWWKAIVPVVVLVAGLLSVWRTAKRCELR